jgi:dienelactone hydrolase
VLGALFALLGATLTLAAPPQGGFAGPSADARIRETVVSLPAGDHTIPGSFAVPRAGGDAGTYPAVLLLHGFASQKNEVGDMYRRLARALAERGYASLRIDFAGSGDSEQPFLNLTYPGMVADARAALEWLISRPETIDDRIGVHGFSLGSMVGATVAGTDARVKAFGSWSGAIYNGSQFPFAGQFSAACEANGGHLILDLGFTQVDLSCAFFSTMQAATALVDIAPYGEPILLVGGSIDTVVDPQTSRNVIPVVDSLDATLRILPGADHIYLVLTPDQTLANECITLTTDWYAQKL